jgi:hypothetical protein
MLTRFLLLVFTTCSTQSKQQFFVNCYWKYGCVLVQRIYEVWHFDETEQYDPKTKTGGLITDYVNTFLKMKQETRVLSERN